MNLLSSIKCVAVVLLAVLGLSACSSYEFGDVSSLYCSVSDEELRKELKAKLEESGLSIGVDYCTVVNEVLK